MSVGVRGDRHSAADPGLIGKDGEWSPDRRARLGRPCHRGLKALPPWTEVREIVVAAVVTQLASEWFIDSESYLCLPILLDPRPLPQEMLSHTQQQRLEPGA
jgi:hypothetical protein